MQGKHSSSKNNGFTVLLIITWFHLSLIENRDLKRNPTKQDDIHPERTHCSMCAQKNGSRGGRPCGNGAVCWIRLLLSSPTEWHANALGKGFLLFHHSFLLHSACIWRITNAHSLHCIIHQRRAMENRHLNTSRQVGRWRGGSVVLVGCKVDRGSVDIPSSL